MMVGRVNRDTNQTGENSRTRIDLAVLSLISLLFGLAVIVKGLIHGG